MLVAAQGHSEGDEQLHCAPLVSLRCYFSLSLISIKIITIFVIVIFYFVSIIKLFLSQGTRLPFFQFFSLSGESGEGTEQVPVLHLVAVCPKVRKGIFIKSVAVSQSHRSKRHIVVRFGINDGTHH